MAKLLNTFPFNPKLSVAKPDTTKVAPPDFKPRYNRKKSQYATALDKKYA